MNAQVALQPFRCTGCGGALVLGTGPSTQCQYCGVDVAVPEQYTALQRVALGYASDKQMAEQLYGRIGEPPGRFLRTWAYAAQGTATVGGAFGLGAVLLMFSHPYIAIPALLTLSYFIGYPVAVLIRGVRWVAGFWFPGYPVKAPLSPYMVLGVTTFLLFFVVAMPMVFFARARALAEVRRDIHASLAADQPQHAGGPSLCRHCGAALDIAPGALGVPCVYCKTDNLVALPKDWIESIRAKEFKHFQSIDAAQDEYRKVSEGVTESIFELFFGLLLAFPVTMLIAFILAKLNFNY